ncbi:DUF6221 family protein [Streptomyces europaeiscabiei]|uniref:DUF6221 family protein n=1 Tax=Streptomyces europaeiscabiei TaxID=146819 RepID=UPI0029B53770|nr:DUF6221 family protein [Streptomyces europaeiscabiei]MDX3582508.1 DUF6221 family protein [Streptomyces europaeiscabiei]
MVDLVQWLTAQLDEDERVALAATQHRWIVSERKTPASADSPSGDPFWVAADEGFGAPAFQFKDKRDAEFIAAHDPARVLREIDAKRKLLARYERAMENRRAHPDDLASAGALLALHGAVKLLAAPYADRPDYEEAVASFG